MTTTTTLDDDCVARQFIECGQCRYQLENDYSRCRYCGGSRRKDQDTGRPERFWYGLFRDEWLRLLPEERTSHMESCQKRNGDTAGRFYHDPRPVERMGGVPSPSWGSFADGSHGGAIGKFGGFPDEIMACILRRCTTETFFIAITAAERLYDIASQDRILLLQYLEHLPGSKLNLGVPGIVSTEELFRLYLERASRNLCGKTLTANCQEICFRPTIALIGLSVLVDQPGRFDSSMAFLMAAQEPIFASIGFDGDVNGNESINQTIENSKPIHIVSNNGVIAVMMKILESVDRVQSDIEDEFGEMDLSGSRLVDNGKYRIEFYGYRGTDVVRMNGAGYDIETPSFRMPVLPGTPLYPVSLAVHSPQRVLILWNRRDSHWQGTAELVHYLRDRGSTTPRVCNLHRPGDLERLLSSRRHGRTGHRPSRIECLAGGRDIAVYLDNDCFPQRTLELSDCLTHAFDTGHRDRPEPLFIKFWDGVPFHGTHITEMAIDELSHHESGPKRAQAHRCIISHLSLAQVSHEEHGGGRDDTGHLCVLRLETTLLPIIGNNGVCGHMVHLDHMPWSRTFWLRPNGNASPGNASLAAKLGGWQAARAAKVGPDGLAAHPDGVRVAAAMTDRILVWTINPWMLYEVENKFCTPSGYQKIKDDRASDASRPIRMFKRDEAADYWVKDYDESLWHELPIIEPIELDTNGALVRQLKWAHNELIVLTDRSIQVWDLSTEACGRRTVQLVNQQHLVDNLS